jgi:predicted HicB family RNase H-like nuclease
MSADRNLITYKGYTGEVRLDVEESILRGRIVNIDDVVTFQGRTIDEVKAEFVNSVDDYLDQCAELGEDPDKPFSGHLTLRMNPETHRVFHAYAKANGWSLNGVIVKVLDRQASRYKDLLAGRSFDVNPAASLSKAGSRKARKPARRKAGKTPSDSAPGGEPGNPPSNRFSTEKPKRGRKTEA